MAAATPLSAGVPSVIERIFTLLPPARKVYGGAKQPPACPSGEAPPARFWNASCVSERSCWLGPRLARPRTEVGSVNRSGPQPPTQSGRAPSVWTFLGIMIVAGAASFLLSSLGEGVG